MSRFRAFLALGSFAFLAFACSSSSSSGGTGSSCNAFCAALNAGSNCTGAGTSCNDECPSLEAQCPARATALFQCLSQLGYECTSGGARALARGAPVGNPPQLNSGSGTLSVEDAECAGYANEFIACTPVGAGGTSGSGGTSSGGASSGGTSSGGTSSGGTSSGGTNSGGTSSGGTSGSGGGGFGGTGGGGFGGTGGGVGGTGGTSGSGGSGGGPVSNDCVQCGLSACPSQSTACLGDTVCNACVFTNSAGPGCTTNPAVLNLLSCTCPACPACAPYCSN